jgi:hypothetical protein
MRYYAEIVKCNGGEVVKRAGPDSRHNARKTRDGMLRNLDRDDYFARVVPMKEHALVPPKKFPEEYLKRYKADHDDVEAVEHLWQWVSFLQGYAETCGAVIKDLNTPPGDLHEKIPEWEAWGKLGDEECRKHSRRGIKLRLRECVKAVKKFVNAELVRKS